MSWTAKNHLPTDSVHLAKYRYLHLAFPRFGVDLLPAALRAIGMCVCEQSLMHSHHVPCTSDPPPVSAGDILHGDECCGFTLPTAVEVDYLLHDLEEARYQSWNLFFIHWASSAWCRKKES